MKPEQEIFKKPDAALIYCRVSSKKQEDEGSGLDGQEHRCRERAQQLGCEVEAIFPDTMTGEGDFMKRPGMVALLAYLNAQTEKTYVVIFDDLKRFARDVEFYRKLRRILKQRGALVDCLNFKIEDTPEGKFIETIIAAQGELEREQNARQVIQKMKARVEQGFWVYRSPIGYEYIKAKGGGKELILHEPLASIVKEALEGYACGRFQTQAEVKRFLESQPEFPKDTPDGKIRPFTVTRFLNKVVYAGYIDAPKWNISRRKGNHPAIISFETFQKIQSRLKTAAHAPIRKNINQDFPLRGFVLCNDCQKPLTSCWSKGRNKKYPYYLCDTKGCVSHRKSIRREVLEGEFGDIVKSLQPKRELFAIARAMFENAWEQRKSQTKHLLSILKQDIGAIEKQTENLLERIIDATSPTVINAYEAKIEALQNQKALMAEKLQNGGVPKGTFSDFIEPALIFLANPWNLWASGEFTLQRIVLRLAFSERIAYCRNKGYRTAKTALPFKVLAGISMGKCEMVEPGGIEPPTSCMPCKAPHY